MMIQKNEKEAPHVGWNDGGQAKRIPPVGQNKDARKNEEVPPVVQTKDARKNEEVPPVGQNKDARKNEEIPPVGRNDGATGVVSGEKAGGCAASLSPTLLTKAAGHSERSKESPFPTDKHHSGGSEKTLPRKRNLRCINLGV